MSAQFQPVNSGPVFFDASGGTGGAGAVVRVISDIQSTNSATITTNGGAVTLAAGIGGAGGRYVNNSQIASHGGNVTATTSGGACEPREACIWTARILFPFAPPWRSISNRPKRCCRP